MQRSHILPGSREVMALASLSLLLTIVLVSDSARLTLADAAPPWYPQGATVGPGWNTTNVQMVSEEVLLVVHDDTQDEEWKRTGTAEATFLMRNQGESEESFDVWFPLGAPDEWGGHNVVGEFRAWVDGVPAEIAETWVAEAPAEGEGAPERNWIDLNPWAHWPVTFPPGQDVLLRVSYDVAAVGWGPHFAFHYVLETGAGWWGGIGQGTVTYRFPYEANGSNVPLLWTLQDDSTSWEPPEGLNLSVSGTDVVWSFSNLEPTDDHNIALTILAPPLWEEIDAARQEMQQYPDQAAPHARLACALVSALDCRGFDCIGNGMEMLEEAEAAFLRATELNPAFGEPQMEEECMGWQYRVQFTPAAPTVPPSLSPEPTTPPPPTEMPVPTVAPTAPATAVPPPPTLTPDAPGPVCPGALVPGLVPALALVTATRVRKGAWLALTRRSHGNHFSNRPDQDH